MKKLFIILSAVVFVLAVASCQKDFMLSKVNCIITLDEANTYTTADSVVFHFSGDVDYIVFYSGETGHQYKFRERYSIGSESVETMKLTLNIQHRNGPDGSVGALEIYYTDSFDGLNGDDAAADKATIEEMYKGGMQGWTKFPYEDPGIDSGVYYTFEAELDHNCIDNLCIAFYWNPTAQYYDGSTDSADTYWLNGSLEVAIDGVGESTTYDVLSLVGTAVMMNEIDGSYYYQDRGDGSIQLNATSIAFQGGTYNAFEHSCEGWLFSYPTSFVADVEPDSGTSVKSYDLEQYEYAHTYSNPGTYLATFICTNANYLGSYRELQEFELTITGEPQESDESGD